MGTQVEMFGGAEAERFEELAARVGGGLRDGCQRALVEAQVALGADSVELVDLVDLRGVALCCRGWRKDLDRRAAERGLSMWGPAQRVAYAAIAPARAAACQLARALYPEHVDRYERTGERSDPLYRLSEALSRRVLIECPRDFGHAEASGGAEPWASLCRLWAAGYAPLGVCGGTLFVWALPVAGGAS